MNHRNFGVLLRQRDGLSEERERCGEKTMSKKYLSDFVRDVRGERLMLRRTVIVDVEVAALQSLTHQI